MKKIVYRTIAYYSPNSGQYSWDAFLNVWGEEGWQLVFTQDLPNRRLCTFMREAP